MTAGREPIHALRGPNTAVSITEGLDALDRLGAGADAQEAIRAGNARRLQAEIRT